MGQNIGERQRWAWLAAGLSAVVAAGACGLSWPWVLLGGLAATAYYIYMDRRAQPEGLASTLVSAFGPAGKVLVVLTWIWTSLVMGWAAGLAGTAFPMVDGFPFLGWVLLALAAWGSKKGAAACARCSGVLCLFLVAIYGIVAVFSVPDVEMRNLWSVGNWTESLWSAGLFLTASGVWYVPCKRSKKGTAWGMAVLLPVFAAVLAAVTAGVLTPALAGSRTVPLYDLAQSVSLFGVVERIEPLLSAAMTMGVFSLLSALACACQALGNQVYSWPWNGAAACVVSACVMYLTRGIPVKLLTAGASVFWVLIPLVAVSTAKRPRKEKQ